MNIMEAVTAVTCAGPCAFDWLAASLRSTAANSGFATNTAHIPSQIRNAK
jgi:hypothetical protein